MAYRLSWSPTARLDLRDLLTYIAEDDPAAARLPACPFREVSSYRLLRLGLKE